MSRLSAMPMAITLAFAFVAACGPSERPKLNIRREPNIAPLPVPEAKEIYKEPVTTTEVTIVEIGAFKGSCDFRFSGLNDMSLIALANATGLRRYRLAGIGVPDSVRSEAHDRLREWLTGEPIGIESEPADPGVEPAIYIYRCNAKSMVNADLVRAGLAVTSDAPSTHRDALSQASMEALSARRGVWGKK